MLRAMMVLPLVSMMAAAADPGLATLEEAGRWKEIRARVQGWVARSPQDAQARYWSSKVKAAFGDLEGALEQGRAALALAPQNADFLAQVAMVLGQKAQGASSRLSQFSLAREMKKLGEQALAQQPGHPGATQLMARFYRMAPGLIGGDNSKAWKLAQALADKDPSEGCVLLGELALMDKDKAKAEAYYRQGVKAAKDPYGPLVALANHLVGEPGEREAPALLARAKLLHPECATAYSLEAYLFAKAQAMGPLEQCLAAWEKIAPGDLAPHYTAASLLIREGKELPWAEALIRRYLSVEPEGHRPTHAHAQRQLGLALEKEGHKTEAIAAFETALKLKPEYKAAQADLKRVKG